MLEIEQKWQKRWEKAGIFKVKEEPKKKKFYVLEMYPYPSASFLHMGHVRNYTIGDVYARFKRMQGFNVLYPMGYDSFGLPAEIAAKKEGVHPKKYTENAIKKIMKYQKALGNSYDWNRIIASHEPCYYKWNQYFFLKFFERGLVYRKKAPVNWCATCGSVLANEEAEGGRCWRCGKDVVKKEMEQWFFKITAYADRLLEDLKKIEWPEKIKKMQADWIGKSYGTEIFFEINGKKWPVFTTRPDTIFGVTFMVISAQHPRLMELVTEKQKKDVEAFVRKCQKVIDQEDAEKLDKEGVFTGSYAINPLTGERVPVYAGNFVLADYGSGMVMAVPAHDQRDFDFAKKYNIPIKTVIQPIGKMLSNNPEKAYVDDGVVVNSGKFSGMDNRTAIIEITKYLESKKLGRKAVNYKIRDWMISRQRYWGTPIPIIYCNKCGIVPEKNLPVLLPERVNFKSSGNPLEANKSFVKCKCPKCKGQARRETDTMGGFMDSSWYFLRYCSPKESKFAFNKKAVKYWMPVDQYIGGAEHAVMHLLYARFFIKALKDMGMVDFDEPFKRLFNQGILYKDGHKMSKSFGNIVTQDEIAKKYGIDTARLFLMFVSSPESQMEWSDEGVIGAYRFIARFQGMINRKIKGRTGKLETKDLIMRAKLHSTIKKVTETMESFKFSITINELMGFFNAVQKYSEGKPHKEILSESLESLTVMLSPFIPHTCEEAWEKLGKKGFVSLAKWPKYNEKFIDRKLEMVEELIESTKEDIRQVLKIIGKSPKQINIYIASLWKYDVYNEILKKAKDEKGIKNVLKSIMQNPETRKQGKHAAMFAERLIKDIRILRGVLTQAEELKAFEEAKAELRSVFGCKVEVKKAELSTSPRAARAEPGKPGIEVID